MSYDTLIDNLMHLGAYDIEDEPAEEPKVLPHERQRKPKG